MLRPTKYDFLIAGGGCAGLSLAVHLVRSGHFGDRSILIVDADEKTENDRTWCFWETGAGPFESVVFRQWDRIRFTGEGIDKTLELLPYRYKMIRGLDFYWGCREELARHPNVHFVQDYVKRLFSSEREGTGAELESGTVMADWIFNSIRFDRPKLGRGQHYLLQHFKGWVIETGQPAFDPAEATLMDFRPSQEQGTTFCYVMPFSERQALVEYTLFSEKLLDPDAYDAALDAYIRDVLGLRDFRVMEREFGVIPMTNLPFSRGYGRIVNIGTAGGQTKGSSGYTFQFIQKHSAALVNALVRTGKPEVTSDPWRFRFYDSVLLDVLANKALPGKQIFSRLFRRNPPQRVLKFLDNETGIGEEIRLISTLPTWPFTRAAMRQLF